MINLINDKNEKVDINILIDVIADTILEMEKEKEEVTENTNLSDDLKNIQINHLNGFIIGCGHIIRSLVKYKKFDAAEIKDKEKEWNTESNKIFEELNKKEKENKELLTEKGWDFNIFYPLWFGEEYLDKKRKENSKKRY